MKWETEGLLMARCVGNIHTKYYQNLIIGFQVTGMFFETQCSSDRTEIQDEFIQNKVDTLAGIPSPADAHFLIHCCRVSIPFCSMPFAMKAPSVTIPVGASTTASRIHNGIIHNLLKVKG